MATNLTTEQIKAIRDAKVLLDSLNTQVHQGRPITGNSRILDAMNILDIAFQDELGISAD